MKTRWKILIAVVIFLFLLIASLLFTAHLQPANAVDTYKKLLRDQGEKLELSKVLPPPVSAESNSVVAVEAAFGLFGSGDTKIPEAMQMVAPGKALIGWQQPDARGYDFTNSWEDFAAEVAANQPGIQLLHQVLDYPGLDFNLDYTKGVMMLLPHLAPMKRATQKLEAAAIFDLHQGDTGSATTNILTMLKLVQADKGEGLIISHLVRIAMTAIALVPTWELLQVTNVPDPQLAALQAGWEHLDFLGDAENAFTMERVWGMNVIEKARASPQEFAKSFGSAYSSLSGSSSSAGSAWDLETLTEKPRYAIGEAMWRSSWSYSDELRLLKSETIILQTLRAMQTNQSQFYKSDYDAMLMRLSVLGITNTGTVFFSALKIPDFSDMFETGYLHKTLLRTLRMETARRVADTAIALKRFQLRHGKWPETLNELVPEFISSMPIDLYDGKALRYHPNADGTYLLYSVGEDGVDDGGDPSLDKGITGSSYYWQGTHARDWVWPQPATAAEIKKYFDEQAAKTK